MAKQNKIKQIKIKQIKLPRLLAVAAVAGPLALSCWAAPQSAYPPQRAYHEEGDWDRGRDYRSPVDQTVRHLEHIASYESRWASGHERERFDTAIRRLSEFESRYERGHFDRGRLDEAIEHVQKVVDHNPLDSNTRRILVDDLYRLRAFRRG